MCSINGVHFHWIDKCREMTELNHIWPGELVLRNQEDSEARQHCMEKRGEYHRLCRKIKPENEVEKKTC